MLTIVTYKYANKIINSIDHKTPNKTKVHTLKKNTVMLANYSRAWGLLWTVIHMLSVTLIVFFVRGRICVHFFSILELYLI